MTTWLFEGLLLIGLAVVFLVLSTFQAAQNSLSRLVLARLREEASGGLSARLYRDAADPPPSRLRVAVQVGRQLCLIGAAIGAAELAEDLGARHSHATGFVLVLVVFTLVIEQIGARVLVLIDPELALRATIGAAGLVSYLLLPLAQPLYRLLRRVRESQGSRERGEPDEEDVRAYLDVGEEEGILEAHEGDMIENVIEFSDTLVREVMTPRTEMVTIAESGGLEELVSLVLKTRHSRIPVYRGSIDHITGFASAVDLFQYWGQARGLTAGELARPVIVVPETKKVSELLRELQGRRQRIAIVVDEYGGTAGLVTAEDLIEEIVGEIKDEHEPEDVQTQPDGSRIVRGRLGTAEASEIFGVDLEGEGFETIGGLVEARLGKIPAIGETFLWRGIQFEVTDVDRRRVRRVRMTRAVSERGSTAAKPAEEQGGPR